MPNLDVSLVSGVASNTILPLKSAKLKEHEQARDLITKSSEYQEREVEIKKLQQEYIASHPLPKFNQASMSLIYDSKYFEAITELNEELLKIRNDYIAANPLPEDDIVYKLDKQIEKENRKEFLLA